ncbi:hypothetical protein HN385_02915 [archaeon]|jgi:hypothetical protein|nr:hypothetical protein [archaeon]MBT3450578.1 hypothetical protein [archaeon]MBT6868432.1 hypothetical protein [archaeon]MBT7193531.1 hypothetical protein [archaeon]MBT7381274.1 hypothetical protein [archaeon]
MSHIPDRKSIEDFADDMIKYDAYARTAIGDGYMTRDESVITTWINNFCNNNTDSYNDFDELLKALELQKPIAYKFASQEFGVSVEICEELFQKSCILRTTYKGKVKWDEE